MKRSKHDKDFLLCKFCGQRHLIPQSTGNLCSVGIETAYAAGQKAQNSELRAEVANYQVELWEQDTARLCNDSIIEKLRAEVKRLNAFEEFYDAITKQTGLSVGECTQTALVDGYNNCAELRAENEQLKEARDRHRKFCMGSWEGK